jgi:hypothetical protein
MFRRSDSTTHASTAAEAAPALRRRDMLRRGAVLAGAAGAAAVALKPGSAGADDGDNLVLGQGNASSVATTLTVGGDAGGVEPALALENADGPSLRMNALSHTWAGQLAVGEIAGTDLGPIVGVETAFGATTTYLVTGVDLANMATPFASTPTRVLDLRTESGRAGIIRRSAADAIAADGKLRAGQWIDVAIAFTGPDFSLDAVFANLTVVKPMRAGHAVLFPPGVLPATSNVNFLTGQTVANAAFVAAGVVQQHHAVRLHTAADAWFVLDVTGGLTRGVAQAPLAQAQTTRATTGRVALVDKVRQALGRIGR